MLVQNDEATIQKCLESAKPFIDYWVIVDIGSKDGTLSIIRECLKDIPGEIHKIVPKNIEETYNAALRWAKLKADYILFMSGDGYMSYNSSFQFPELSKDVYCLFWHTKQRQCLRRQIIKASLPWSWKIGAGTGNIYDYLLCELPCQSAVIKEMRYIHGVNDFDTNALLKKENDNDEQKGCQHLDECRKVLALAEKYRLSGEKEKALECYRKRLDMGADACEIFGALLQIARLQQDLSYPIDDVIDAYYKAYRYCPTRVEPVYCLAHLYNQRKEYALAYECIKSWSYIPRPEKKGVVGAQSWMEEYGILLELSLCSFYIKKYQEALDVSDTLLKVPGLSEEIRKRVNVNRNLILKELAAKKSGDSTHVQ